MNGPTQKPAPTLADYQAAEARLREVRDEAAAGIKVSQDKGDVAAGDAWATRLKNEFDNFKAFREGLPRDVLLSIHADRILQSVAIKEEQGWKATLKRIFGRESMRMVSLEIPADVSDEEAIHALNARFRDMFPDKDRGAIYESDLEQILDSGGGSGRRVRGPRVIKLLAVVPGTTSKNRDQQAEVLKQKGLTFSHPIEQALAAAAYACKRSGEDLFNDLVVRGSVPGVALSTDQSDGVSVSGCSVGGVYSVVAASGSPSPPRLAPRGKPELKEFDR